jgi:transcriptional regulator with XRE-family HTH domain
MSYSIPRALKDNAWQRERIARDLTFGDIAKHFKLGASTVAHWFRGAHSPSIDQTAELCRWFTELDPSRPIDYDIGKAEFETMERNFKKIGRRDPVMLKGENKERMVTGMERLRREMDISYEDISSTARVSMTTVYNWFRGINVPAGFRCERLKSLFGLTADDIRDRFKEDHAEYLKAHEDPNQLKIEDIPVCDQAPTPEEIEASEEEPKSDWADQAEAEREEIKSDWKVLTDAIAWLTSRPIPFRDEVLDVFVKGTIDCIHEGSALYYGGLSALYSKGGISFDEFMDVCYMLREGGFI